MKRSHSMPFGAEFVNQGTVRFRLWAPKAQRVDLLLGEEEAEIQMTCIGDGWFEVVKNPCEPGSRYKFQIDGTAKVPDPVSRFQPSDVHGPSEVIEPTSFDWQDEGWLGRPWEETVFYELHVGTFSPEGTFAGVEKRLDYLADLGVTAIELMPLADFPGARNWGYDGVFLFAPDSRYGRPEDLKHLIQSAHARGLMMFLDVVYNHFGPEGNYLYQYAPQFFNDRHQTPWGSAINFDGPHSRPVRDFVIHNAIYWLKEYHFDGLRLDAVHAIVDDSSPDILTELAKTVRNTIKVKRHIHLVLENDDNRASYLQRTSGRTALFNAQWNDDIHHALHVTITGEHDGYYADYADCPVKHVEHGLEEGFDYQGQSSAFRGGKMRGEPCADLPPSAFVSFLQNHDQVGNRAFGERIVKLAQPKAIRAAVAILLLAPSPPLLFMGEEFGAETPFLFFCDFEPGLAKAVTEGRRSEFARFARFQDPQQRLQIPDPSAKGTFERSKLDWKSADDREHAEWLDSYRELLRLRQANIVSRQWLPLTSEFRMFDCQGFSVAWQADNAKLSLIANLSETSVSATRPEGELLHGSDSGSLAELESGRLCSWSTFWFLKR